MPTDGPREAVAVLLKRVDLRPQVDPLTGEATLDPHGGMSPADRCALELALQFAERDGHRVLAATAGTPDAEVVLRAALEAGADRAVRVDMPADAASAAVAAGLAGVVAASRWIWCGDLSLDRGSGAVPAFVAGRLGATQALGIAAVTFGEEEGLVLERRLDGGRREVLRVGAPAVVSVESGLVSPRRPSLAAVLAARRAPVEVVAGPPSHQPATGRVRPFRPRPRVLEGPDPSRPPFERLLALSGALVQREPPRVVRAEPDQAVDELLAFLRSRGYLADEQDPEGTEKDEPRGAAGEREAAGGGEDPAGRHGT